MNIFDKRYSRLLIALLVLSAGALLTFFTAHQRYISVQSAAVQQFITVSNQTTIKINERLSARALNLINGVALFAASNGVTRDEWRTYVSYLLAEGTLAGVQGMGYAKLIKPDDLQKEIRSVRAEGFPDFTIRPPGERDVYTSIIYLEPFDARNQRAFGFDMYSEPVRREAMERARDTGDPALSGKVQLMQENGKDIQHGVLIYVPVYKNGADKSTVEERRESLIGWIYSPFRMNNLMSDVLSQENDTGTSTQSYTADSKIGVRIYSGSSIDSDNLLFDSLPEQSIDLNSPFTYRQKMSVYGQEWLILYSSPQMAAEVSYVPVILVGIIGVLATLLTLVVLIDLQTRAKALRESEKLMAALQASEAEVRQLAFNDPLTGLANRRLLDDRINQTILHCQRQERFAGLIMFDLDKFKQLNDTYGHAVGDQVLIEVAKRVMNAVRATDTVSRIGGDEFAILLDELGDQEAEALNSARTIAETICHALALPHLISDKSTSPTPIEYRCTASLGVGIFKDQESAARARNDADAALYAAKAAGGSYVG